jgi:phospholipase/carboxylesterase
MQQHTQNPVEWLPASGSPQQLMLLLHGWGNSAQDMAPLAQTLRQAFPQAALVAPDAPHPFERGQAGGTARQWYSINDLTPAVWPGRVAATLPALRAWVQAQQQRLGVAPAATALVGFSQGAIVALHLALQDDGMCGRVLSFGGCLVAPPAAAPRHTTLHFFHGADDTVIPAARARESLAWLADLQGDATLDVATGVGHELHPALVSSALHRLRSHVPLRTWQAAMGAMQAAESAPD